MDVVYLRKLLLEYALVVSMLTLEDCSTNPNIEEFNRLLNEKQNKEDLIIDLFKGGEDKCLKS